MGETPVTAQLRLHGIREGMIKMQPLNSAVPADVREEFETAQRDIVAGKLQPFTGPIRDQDGKERVAAGKVLSEAEPNKMNYLVEGVEGTLPKP